MAEAKQIYLKLTSAIGIAGELKRRDSIVLVDQALAANLMHRGKAALPTAAELEAAGIKLDAAPAGNDDDSKTDAKPSEGLSTAQLKEALTAKGINIPEGAKKADLAALLDAAPAGNE